MAACTLAGGGSGEAASACGPPSPGDDENSPPQSMPTEGLAQSPKCDGDRECRWRRDRLDANFLVELSRGHVHRARRIDLDLGPAHREAGFAAHDALLDVVLRVEPLEVRSSWRDRTSSSSTIRKSCAARRTPRSAPRPIWKCALPSSVDVELSLVLASCRCVDHDIGSAGQQRLAGQLRHDRLGGNLRKVQRHFRARRRRAAVDVDGALGRTLAHRRVLRSWRRARRRSDLL